MFVYVVFANYCINFLVCAWHSLMLVMLLLCNWELCINKSSLMMNDDCMWYTQGFVRLQQVTIWCCLSTLNLSVSDGKLAKDPSCLCVRWQYPGDWSVRTPWPLGCTLTISWWLVSQTPWPLGWNPEETLQCWHATKEKQVCIPVTLNRVLWSHYQCWRSTHIQCKGQWDPESTRTSQRHRVTIFAGTGKLLQ